MSSSPSSSSSTTMKLYFSLPSGKQEIRRFTTAAPEVLPALLAFLSATYSRHFSPPLRFSVAYDDGEDLCSVSSEAELQEGLQLHAASAAGGVIKLLCRFDDSIQQEVMSPNALSGMSTPSINVLAAENSPQPSSVSEPIVTVVESQEEPQETGSEESIIASPSVDSVASAVEDGELVNDAHESDDEYERISEEPTIESTEVAPQAAAAEVVASSPRVEENDAPSQSPEVSIEDVTSHPEPSVASSSSSSSSATTTEHADAVSWLWGDEAAAPVISSASTPAVHTGFSCNECGIGPIVGSRFHCDTCKVAGGYDLCVVCEANVGHFPLSHDMVEFKTPAEAKVYAAAMKTDEVKKPEEVKATAKVEVATSSSSTSSSSSVAGPAVHTGVTCDGCRLSPLTGNRYHCTTCSMPGGFDLCESCEQSGDKHPSSHLMMKMRVPVADGVAPMPNAALKEAGIIPSSTSSGKCTRNTSSATGPCARPRPWATCSSADRPRAQFLSDVTCADGMQVHAGETLRKTWSIKNVGSSAWPTGVRLIFVGGDLMPESEGLCGADGSVDSSPAFGAIVPFAGPGDVVHVSIDIVVPNESGRFRGSFRLQTKEGDRFGPRIWIDLSVPAPVEVEVKEQKKEDEVVVVAPVVEAAPVVAAAVVAPVIVAQPIAMPVKSAPVPVAAIAAPASAPVAVVESKQKEEEKVTAAASASPSFPVSSKWGNAAREAALGHAAESALAAEFSAAHIAPLAPVPATQPRAAAFQYSNQLAILRSMGFADKELCKYLLLNNRGDLEKVIQWLLANASK